MATSKSFTCQPVSVVYFEHRSEYIVQSRDDEMITKTGFSLRDTITSMERRLASKGNDNAALLALREIKRAGEQDGWDVALLAARFADAPPTT